VATCHEKMWQAVKRDLAKASYEGSRAQKTLTKAGAEGTQGGCWTQRGSCCSQLWFWEQSRA